MEKRKALVIDDEQIVLDSVSTLLRDEGFDVDVSLSGREGLDWAIERKYDVILTDIRMPDIGGMRVLRDVKRIHQSLPVIMITGYASVDSAVQAMKLGAADYIEKPFEPEQLIDSVNRALGVSPETEEQGLIHKDEVAKVLERAEADDDFFMKLLEKSVDALDEYDLTKAEKLAVVTGDVRWIEDQLGRLTRAQRRMLIFLKIQSKS
ncbi:MAG: response regulator [Deltaproteobacteria bacterium]|nr:MAG: response regulator [Deltaproteobacteria bacterium]